MSIHQGGNSQSSERENVLQRSSGSSAVLGDMVSKQTLIVKNNCVNENYYLSSCVSLVCLFRPNVRSPCRADEAALWLRGGGEERKTDSISVSPQQVYVLMGLRFRDSKRKTLQQFLSAAEQKLWLRHNRQCCSCWC